MADKLEKPATTLADPAPVAASMIPSIPTGGGGIIAVALSVVGGLLFLRRRISRDGLEVTKDGAEGEMLRTAIAERDKAMATASDAWRTRTEDAKLIGKLTSDVEHLTKINEGTRTELEELRKNIRGLQELIGLFLPHSVTAAIMRDGSLDLEKLRAAIYIHTGNRIADAHSTEPPTIDEKEDTP